MQCHLWMLGYFTWFGHSREQWSKLRSNLTLTVIQCKRSLSVSRDIETDFQEKICQRLFIHQRIFMTKIVDRRKEKKKNPRRRRR